MLDRLERQSPDALLALIKLHEADPRPAKIDLGVGVYKTAEGATPVFGAIKSAEQRLVDRQQSKSYLGPEGDTGFVRALAPHVFGGALATDGRIEGMQTPGGTGAVRLALALAKKAGAVRVIMGTPSWPNHEQILDDLQLELVAFNHAGVDGNADMNALRDALAGAGEGDVLLLHGCCHNPTGVDYTHPEWDEITTLIGDSRVLPVIDLAYQGLGEGMVEDAHGLRTVILRVPEVMVAYSCDKNFGLYRDRVGAFWVQTAESEATERAITNAAALARANWSMPPDHGAAAVRLVLEDEALTADWQDELASMRERIGRVRQNLAASSNAGGVDLTPLGRQKGMFAMLPVDRGQVARLRDDHGVYMAGSGRINVAGLTMDNVDTFVTALEQVTRVPG